MLGGPQHKASNQKLSEVISSATKVVFSSAFVYLLVSKIMQTNIYLIYFSIWS